jgi:hypothetical protein
MSYHATMCELEMKNSVNWPMVAAAPGYSVLDERFPNCPAEDVLAWRVGPNVSLPVTRLGFKAEEAWVKYPDGRVRPPGAERSARL